MVRLFTPVAQKVYMALLFVKDQLGDSGYNLNDYTQSRLRQAGGFWRDQEIQRRVQSYLDYQSEYVDTHPTIDELASTVADQMTNTLSPSDHDKDLIDTVVRICQMPHNRNQLTAEMMDRLRKAVLIPEELVALKAKLERQEFHCSCGHEFTLGEMVCFSRDGRTKAGIFCLNCVQPTMMACENGKHSRPMPKGLMNSIIKAMKAICEKCQNPEVEPERHERPTIGGGGNPLGGAGRFTAAYQGPPTATGRTRQVPPRIMTIPAPPPQQGRGLLHEDEPIRGLNITPGAITFDALTTITTDNTWITTATQPDPITWARDINGTAGPAPTPFPAATPPTFPFDRLRQAAEALRMRRPDLGEDAIRQAHDGVERALRQGELEPDDIEDVLNEELDMMAYVEPDDDDDGEGN